MYELLQDCFVPNDYANKIDIFCEHITCDHVPPSISCLLMTSQLLTLDSQIGNVVTLALGSRPRQRGCKSAGQEEAQESHSILPGVRKCEGVNPHTPKATPTLGDGVPVDSRNFKERFQGSKLNGLWRSLYHWKPLEM